MKAVLTFDETAVGRINIVIPKIRAVFKGLGNVVIEFDHGDTQAIDTMEPDSLIKEIVKAINAYYSNIC